MSSELDLDRAPGNQLFLTFFFSAVLGGLASPVGCFDCDLLSTGLDTAREASTETPRTAGGWAETLRPRALGSGGAWCGCRRFGCSLALDGGRSGLPSRGRDAGGVGCVDVTAGTGGGVSLLVRTAGGGGGGGGDKGIVGTFCSFFRGDDSEGAGFSESGETCSMGDRGVADPVPRWGYEASSDLESSLVLVVSVAVLAVLVGELCLA